MACLAAAARAQSGRELIEESLRRYAQPAYVYQEQALVLSDRLGRHSVRTTRYYAQNDEDGSKNLLVIETPAESKGTALFVERRARAAVRLQRVPFSVRISWLRILRRNKPENSATSAATIMTSNWCRITFFAHFPRRIPLLAIQETALDTASA
jgi:hypothetical protein